MSEHQDILPLARSIAVLPFVNMSADPGNEYFSDGITEEIINALTKVKGLKVIARTSCFAFKHKQVDIREIGKQLQVSTILEGSVRRVAQRVRITAQLINALDGTHLWSENFDRQLNDIFALQDEVSLLIADQVRANSGHFVLQDHLVRADTSNMKAYEWYLKGRWEQLKWEPEALRQANEYYTMACEEDAHFARAYYGLVQCYGLLAAWGYMPAEEGFERAIANFVIAQELNQELPEYHMTFVGKHFWQDWNFQQAYEHILSTLAVNGSYTDALEAMTELMLAHGLFDKAMPYINRALSLDPLSANHHYTLANIYYMQRDFTTSLKHIGRSLELNPDFALAHLLRSKCLIWIGDWDQLSMTLDDSYSSELITLLYHQINSQNVNPDEGTALQWEDAANIDNQLSPLELFILANSDYKQRAMDLLRQYIDRKRGQIINFRQEPFLAPLHQFDDFAALHVSNLEMLPAEDRPSEAIGNEGVMDESWAEAQAEKLLQHMSTRQPHLQAQLSLAQLADSMQLHPNQLSWLINERIGKNFNEFINGYRLESFKARALDPANRHLTILGIAYESGFNSKTVFNTFFKKSEGLSPRKWLKQQS